MPALKEEADAKFIYSVSLLLPIKEIRNASPPHMENAKTAQNEYKIEISFLIFATLTSHAQNQSISWSFQSSALSTIVTLLVNLIKVPRSKENEASSQHSDIIFPHRSDMILNTISCSIPLSTSIPYARVQVSLSSCN